MSNEHAPTGHGRQRTGSGNDSGSDSHEVAPVVDLHAGRRSYDVDRALESIRASAELGDRGDEATELGERLRHALPQPPLALRVVIAVLALAQFVVVLPWFVDADPFGLLDQPTSAHLARDGALGLVVAAAAMLGAWRPRWVLPTFAIASVALVAQAVAGVLDDSVVENPEPEFVHLPSVILVCLLGLSAVRLKDLGPRR